MSFNGSGTFNLATGNPVVTGTTISSTWANNTLSDIATGLSNCITRDGQSPATANIPMGTHKLTGLSAGTTAGDSARYEQVTSAVAITGGAIDGTPIGGTTPAAGAFTTLSASSTVTLSGGTANGVLYLNGSKVATSGSALTFDGTTLATTGSEAFRVKNDNGFISFYNSGNTARSGYIQFNAVTPTSFVNEVSQPFTWSTAGSEQMRLTSTGLGIGTSSPSTKLQVVSGGIVARFGAYGTTTYDDFEIQSYAGYNAIGTRASADLAFNIAGSQKMYLNSSGNLGLGVTPSAWSGLSPSLQMGYGSIYSAAFSVMGMASVAYYNGGWKYYSTGQAPAQYQMSQGAHTWYTAPSGTAGAAISFTQAMTLDASGNLLVQNTTASFTSGIGHKLLTDAAGPATATVGSASSSAYQTYNLYSTGAAAYRFYVDYSGTIHATSTSITAISDQSLKTNIRILETGLSEVLALQPRRFDWKNGDGENKAGFIAQEVEQILPDLVAPFKYNDSETKLGLKMGDMIPTLVKAIQEQQALIESLTARINTLEGK